MYQLDTVLCLRQTSINLVLQGDIRLIHLPSLHDGVLGATLLELFLKQYEGVVCPNPTLLSDGPISVHYRFVAFLLIPYIIL